jgi:hypothetical protein
MLFNESERLGSIARKQDEAKERMIFKLKNQPDEDVFWIMEKVRRREESQVTIWGGGGRRGEKLGKAWRAGAGSNSRDQ